MKTKLYLLFVLGVVFVIAALMIAGCSKDSGTGDDNTPADTTDTLTTDSAGPGTLTLIGTYSGFVRASEHGLYVNGNVAYVLDRKHIELIDVSDGANPVEIGRYPDEDYDGYLIGIDGAGNTIVLKEGTSGSILHILDASSPSSLSEVGSITLARYASDVFVAGGYAYAPIADLGCAIVDISDPSVPSQVGTATAPNGVAAAVYDNHLYLACETFGFRTFDITEPTAPVQISGISTGGWPTEIAALDGYIYIADEVCRPPSSAGHFAIYSDSSLGVAVYQDSLTDGTLNSCRAVALGGCFAYVVSQSCLYVYQVYHPATAVRVHIYELPSTGKAVYVVGHTVYVLCENDLVLLDHSYSTTGGVL